MDEPGAGGAGNRDSAPGTGLTIPCMARMVFLGTLYRPVLIRGLEARLSPKLHQGATTKLSPQSAWMSDDRGSNSDLGLTAIKTACNKGVPTATLLSLRPGFANVQKPEVIPVKAKCALVAGFCFLLAAFSAASQTAPLSASAQVRLREYGRAIHILRQGLNEGWTREQYFKAFDSGGGYGPADGIAKKEVRSVLESKLPERTIWDEKPPLSVQVTETIAACNAAQNVIRKAELTPASPPI
jgi:hypothetical protein